MLKKNNSTFKTSGSFGQRKGGFDQATDAGAVQAAKKVEEVASPEESNVPSEESVHAPKYDYGNALPIAAAAPSNLNVNLHEKAPAQAQPKPAVKAPEKKQTSEAEKELTPFLKSAYETVWNMIKKGVDFRRFSGMSKEEIFEDMLLSVQEVSKMEEMKLSEVECELVCRKIIDEMLGLGPIEPLLLWDDVSEIMVNGPKTIYLEINGMIERSAITFKNNEHLISVCQRIAARVGRRADESSPMCDARLPDGSRVNIILPPLALDGAILTIRKFQKERLTLEKIQEFGSVDETTAEIIRIIAACRVNILVSGGTGSGKTTLLNCLTRYISPRERIVTCEDAAELQLQQPHVVRLETRPPNLEGIGEVTMRDLVKNCLRMRPDRIVLGEVRGAEAFDLLQAMNTGHDGSMGTIHANNPRDAIARLENMIAMARLNIPTSTMRQQIASSVNVIIQIQRLKDGSRKVMSITEIDGMEGDIITMHDLVAFHIEGEDASGRLQGSFKSTGIRPNFAEKLRQFGMEARLLKLMEQSVTRD